MEKQKNSPTNGHDERFDEISYDEVSDACGLCNERSPRSHPSAEGYVKTREKGFLVVWVGEGPADPVISDSQ